SPEDAGRSACLQLVADRRNQARVPAYAVTVGQGKLVPVVRAKAAGAMQGTGFGGTAPARTTVASPRLTRPATGTGSRRTGSPAAGQAGGCRSGRQAAQCSARRS